MLKGLPSEPLATRMRRLARCERLTSAIIRAKAGRRG